MKYSFVLVNYADSWQLISACLESVARDAEAANTSYEAIIIDNDPPGETEKSFLKARILASGRNIGFARAVNLGIREATGDVVVLINPDSVVGAGFFAGVSGFLESHRRVGVIGPLIRDVDGRVQLSARREFSFISGLFGRTSFLTRLFPGSRVVRDHFPATESEAPLKVDWVSGACMAVRCEVFEAVGLLDERFFMYFEDADLCRRARGAGYEVFYLPRIEVVHDAGGSTTSRPLAIFRLHKSAFLYHRKHGSHGPFGVFSAAVLAGLAARAFVGIAASFVKTAK